MVSSSSRPFVIAKLGSREPHAGEDATQAFLRITNSLYSSPQSNLLQCRSTLLFRTVFFLFFYFLLNFLLFYFLLFYFFVAGLRSGVCPRWVWSFRSSSFGQPHPKTSVALFVALLPT
jgi:hypothetical protein